MKKNLKDKLQKIYGDRKLAWESLAIDINHLIKKYDLMFENINDYENS